MARQSIQFASDYHTVGTVARQVKQLRRMSSCLGGGNISSQGATAPQQPASPVANVHFVGNFPLSSSLHAECPFHAHQLSTGTHPVIMKMHFQGKKDLNLKIYYT